MNGFSHLRVRALKTASLWATAATAFLALSPAARAAEQAIPFHGQDSAIFRSDESQFVEFVQSVFKGLEGEASLLFLRRFSF